MNKLHLFVMGLLSVTTLFSADDFSSLRSINQKYFFQAIENGDEKEFDLLSKKADVNAKDDRGFTPLYVAALSGSDVFVKKLLGAGAEVNEMVNGASTPLAIAARLGYEEIAKMLMENGADVRFTPMGRKVPLIFKVLDSSNKNKAVEDIALMLINKGAIQTTYELNNSFIKAVQRNRRLVVEELLKNDKIDVALIRDGLAIAQKAMNAPMIQLLQRDQKKELLQVKQPKKSNGVTNAYKLQEKQKEFSSNSQKKTRKKLEQKKPVHSAENMNDTTVILTSCCIQRIRKSSADDWKAYHEKGECHLCGAKELAE